MKELFNNIEFAYPYVFGLFLLIPLMVWWYLRKYNEAQSSVKVSTVRTFPGRSFKPAARHSLFGFRLVAVACLILAVARPQQRNDEHLTEGEGIDIVLCIDISGSMLSRDFQPNRLAVAKEVASEFIDSRPIDQIGLVIFSGESFTMSPITTDKSTLLAQVASLQSGMLQDGTLIGEGLATAVARLAESQSKSKVVILLTDGKEQPTKDRLISPQMALDMTRSKNIKVYTIGMALEGYEAAEEKTAGGSVIQTAPATLDEDLLKQISDETGGRYFRARDKDGLKKIYNEIDQLEKSKLENISFKRVTEKFPFLVLLALGLLGAELLLRYTFFRKFP